jgi:hypothetical protein
MRRDSELEAAAILQTDVKNSSTLQRRRATKIPGRQDDSKMRHYILKFSASRDGLLRQMY